MFQSLVHYDVVAMCILDIMESYVKNLQVLIKS